MPESRDAIFKEYTVKRKLGAGGYGTVYLVENDKGIPFALKVLHKDVTLFEREARETIGITDPRLVKVIDYGETVDGEPCILMEYVPENLETALDWDNIPEEQAVELFREIMHGLQTLENHGLLHRDIKPENLFLAGNVVKIGDFGSARITSGESVSMSQNAAMTIHYSSPERFDTSYGFEVDRWAAAVIFCRMLGGYVPFGAQSSDLQSIMKSIILAPPDLSTVPDRFKPFLEKAFEKNPADRHADVQEMRDHFEECSRMEFVFSDFSDEDEVYETAEETADEYVAESEDQVESDEAEYEYGLEVNWAEEPGDGEQIEDPVTGHYLWVWVESNSGIEFVWVCSGKFDMGDEDGYEDEQPLHLVELDGFWISRYPITQRQWKALMGENPSYFPGDTNPVESVSWYDTQQFIRKLSAATDWAYTFSLPTEAQWEYAARSCGMFEKYSGSDNVNRVAWYSKNSHDTTHPVGQKAPNGIGLYDMSGNVWEWCEDWFSPGAYAVHAAKNPITVSYGEQRCARGGSWGHDAEYARTVNRFGLDPESKFGDLGFRLVRER
ncbi:SUMF1/EgtB/PvdO family nonheme iron enzyme [Maridesulfovibrio sp. FT414]|uniref:SUMF1/EgtB/PvdO family nonheme iron enzyme n=1 Tax=Maridesulfovibrio sp. FT414 TaxID=2979469 RepID=UPI003D804D5B